MAVYQRALKLLYVDELLARMKAEFPAHYKPKHYDYPAFTDAFERARAELEASAEAAGRRGGAQAPRGAGAGGRKVRCAVLPLPALLSACLCFYLPVLCLHSAAR